MCKVFARYCKVFLVLQDVQGFCKVFNGMQGFFLQNVQDVQGFCKVFARFCKVCKPCARYARYARYARCLQGFLQFVIIKSNKMSRTKFEPENIWKVNDIDYEDVNSDNYVYPTARRVAPVA